MTQAESAVAQADSETESKLSRLEEEGDIAADYLEGLLDIADLDGDIDMDVEGDRAAVSIVGEGLSHLVGQNGEVLEALQELMNLGTEAVEQAKSSGQGVRLSPMSPFERKVVHDTVAAAGLRSESEGEEPNRCVIVYPV
jgi:spoIIIJ-associated protein